MILKKESVCPGRFNNVLSMFGLSEGEFKDF